VNGESAASTGKSDAEKTIEHSSSSSINSQQQQDEEKKRSKPLDFIRKLRPTGGHQTDYSQRNGASSDSGARRKSPEPLKVYARF